MKAYFEREAFSLGDMALYERAEWAFQALPERDSKGRDLRCHEVARIVFQMLPDFAPYDVEIVDGRYGHVEHSWLNLRPRLILDPYAVGRVPPVALVDTTLGLGDMYRPGPRRTDIRTDVIDDMGIELRACF